jgi:hypothetical protein
VRGVLKFGYSQCKATAAGPATQLREDFNFNKLERPGTAGKPRLGLHQVTCKLHPVTHLLESCRALGAGTGAGTGVGAGAGPTLGATVAGLVAAGVWVTRGPDALLGLAAVALGGSLGVREARPGGCQYSSLRVFGSNAGEDSMPGWVAWALF